MSLRRKYTVCICFAFVLVQYSPAAQAAKAQRRQLNIPYIHMFVNRNFKTLYDLPFDLIRMKIDLIKKIDLIQMNFPIQMI